MVAIAPGLMAVGTARYGGPTRVEVEIVGSKPNINPDQWDQVLECSLYFPSGKLRLSVPETGIAAEDEISVAPGIYRAFVLYGSLDSVADNASLMGDDHYKVILWPGEKIRLTVLKKWRARKR